MTLRLLWRGSRLAPSERLRHTVQAFLFAAGCLALAYSGLAYFQAAMFQSSEISRLDLSMPAARSPGMRKAMVAALRRDITSGSPFGRIDIPRVGLSSVVVEGITARNLRLAVGHIPGTAFPGDTGNVAIAGHRDTFFRKLSKIRADDTIILTTIYGSYEYVVADTQIVRPDNLSVIRDSTGPTLTLITCYPFYYVGPAPKRFIVYARQTTVAGIEQMPAVVPVSSKSPPMRREPPLDRLFGVRGWFEKTRASR